MTPWSPIRGQQVFRGTNSPIFRFEENQNNRAVLPSYTLLSTYRAIAKSFFLILCKNTNMGKIPERW